MPEGEEAPSVCLSKPLVIFDGDINSVVFAVEISASRWLCARPVWEGRLKNASEFFNNDRSFGELTCLQIRFNVLLFYVDVMIFGKVCLSVVEPIGCQRSADKHPPPKCGWVWQLQFAVRFKNGARLVRLGSRKGFRDQ